MGGGRTRLFMERLWPRGIVLPYMYLRLIGRDVTLDALAIYRFEAVATEISAAVPHWDYKSICSYAISR